MRTRTTYVYMHLAEGPVPAGRLDMTEDGRNSYATFQYGARYLRRPNRVPVDPAALALPDPDAAAQTFRTTEGFDLFNGIRDAAPDGWGRYLMHKAAGSENLAEFDYLIASGDHRVGALAFGPDPTGGPKRVAPWGEEEPVGQHFNLAELAEAAERVQSVDRLDHDLRRLLEAGSSLGGARPKAATTHHGVPWIAKFSAKDDTYPVCRIELAVMRLAKHCELDVPDIDFKTILRRDIYLIRRFDRQVEGNQLKRIPFASALTMLEAHEMRLIVIPTAILLRYCAGKAQTLVRICENSFVAWRSIFWSATTTIICATTDFCSMVAAGASHRSMTLYLDRTLAQTGVLCSRSAKGDTGDTRQRADRRGDLRSGT